MGKLNINGQDSIFASATSEFAITAHDSNVQEYMGAIHIGVAGDVAISRDGGSTSVIYKGCVAGTQIPVSGDDVTVKDADTTATDLVGMVW